MNFNDHSTLAGKHALLSASKSAWINYEPEKLLESIERQLAAAKGTRLHNFAAEAIKLGIKLPKTKKTLDAYVNDAIGFRMTPEQVLHYSDNAFGTADAIRFDARRNELRIHDLKTGTNPTSFVQLEIYCAFFCLEYGYKPSNLKMELRIYQNDDMKVHIPTAEAIDDIMATIVYFDNIIEQAKADAAAEDAA